MTPRICWLTVVNFLLAAAVAGSLRSADSPPISRVSPPGEFPDDARLKPPRTLRDLDHPWTPPQTKSEWEQQRQHIRTQLLVACGLWPLPEMTPLKPVIHGRVDRDDYTVERVFFASRPGLYVTGSLFRPKGMEGLRPGILCPHGHWANGRFYDAGEDAAAKQIEAGAESLPSAARFPLQARMVQLARMGCVVFHYDMIGYADNGPLDHRSGFSDPQAELWSQNIMGLQTLNSLRALDFITSLPDVDPARIGVTGASGGGTQTFVLGAIDPRPAVAFPAVMVSTNMQGGCVCENASYLRQDINNIAFAACFAPKPLGMTGAADWTIDIERKGLPELKQVWSLYGEPDLVHARCFPQFGHNYNRVSREMMYGWMNRHLDLGLQEPIVEGDFQPLTRDELTVFTPEHPRPDDALPAESLRARLTDEARMWYADLLERAKSNPAEYRRIVGAAADVMFGPPPTAEQVAAEETARLETEDGIVTRGWCLRAESGERNPWVCIQPKDFKGEVTLWIDGDGKQTLFENGRPISSVRRLLDRGHAVLSADIFLTGEFLPVAAEVSRHVNEQFAGYTFGYNRPLIAQRVRDILSLAVMAAGRDGTRRLHLTGTGSAGPWVLLARGRLADSIGETRAEVGDFSFAALDSTQHADFLPAALKFGGLGGVLALAGPVSIEVINCGDHAARELQPFVDLGGKLRKSNQRLIPSRE